MGSARGAAGYVVEVGPLRCSPIISAQRSTHSLQMATDGVGPHTMGSTSAYPLPQNEHRIPSRSNPALGLVKVRQDPGRSSAIRTMLDASRLAPAGGEPNVGLGDDDLTVAVVDSEAYERRGGVVTQPDVGLGFGYDV